jgi:sugar O-acyltransferase (sialic acid O-acetyltransferase NeuD family)
MSDAANELPVVIYGAGGHAKVVCDVLQCAGRVVLGFIDDDLKRQGTTALGLPVLGPSTSLDPTQHAVALGIGDNAVRSKVYDACVARGLEVVTAIHPRAVVARSATLGAGTVVMALAVVNPDAMVGRGVIVNTAAVVEHDVVVGDFAHLSPNAAMGGAARLGARAHLGVGANVLPGVSVGEGSVVGAGAVVARDVPANVVAYGVPARVARSR